MVGLCRIGIGLGFILRFLLEICVIFLWGSMSNLFTTFLFVFWGLVGIFTVIVQVGF